MSSNISGLMLNTGEHIIGEIEGDLITNPAQVSMFSHQHNSSQLASALIPFIPFADENSKIVINPNAITARFTPSVQILNEYNRLFGSGIEVVSSSLVSKFMVN